MADKENREILWGDVQFNRQLIEAFQKPLRKNIEPIRAGSVVEFEPDYRFTDLPNTYGLVLDLKNRNAPLIAPVSLFKGYYASESHQEDFIISDTADTKSMGFSRPVVVHLSQASPHKLRYDIDPAVENRMLLLDSKRYPVLRGVGHVAELTMTNITKRYTKYLEHQEAMKEVLPKLSDDLPKRVKYRSTCADLLPFGLPEKPEPT